MINRQRCKMEYSAQDRQFKSKIEEDWMIMNMRKYYFVNNSDVSKNYSILGKQVRKIFVITSWTDQKLAGKKKFNTITEGRPGTSVAQHLHDTEHGDRGR